jgi:hypothetical protein
MQSDIHGITVGGTAIRNPWSLAYFEQEREITARTNLPRFDFIMVVLIKIQIF